jgi:hypothetical protein
MGAANNLVVLRQKLRTSNNRALVIECGVFQVRIAWEN